ncbi:hypothetical protein BLA28_08410 [Eisenbergiella tayi]|uniref:DUF4015 domain-containing protein n=1 Tax=Eisenbergiella tayi TaxID=1432052 RepID=A0A1E3AK98_9FIRM|nr:putative glycoside hydrolase [Eisenbergiella tayi]ODM09134.1 hypothetical protein BEH84_04884 [Eisenbergiella tayi]OIZ66910.1 hypothetical protein BLA28_08410 [Eisenbergiella tayi]
MRKKSIVAAALLCILIIGITSLYLAGCSNTAKETAVLEEAGKAVSGNAVSENTDDRAGTDTDSDTVKGTEAETGNGETEAQEETVTEPFAEKVRVKGIYVTGAMAGTSNMDNLIALVDRTELNTMVIDVKNDEGRVVYDMDSAFVREIGAVKEYVSDMPGLIRKCKEHGIYLIARIVAFKDPFLAENRQDLALTDKNGNIFRDKSGLAWVNPYKREVWDYLLEIARQAASVGFDEIQFDYIRFSTDAGMSKVDFGEDALEQDKEDVITEFTIYAAQELHDMGVPLSADVYGVIIDSKLDASIVGQNYYEMAKHLDYISPMVYPSHYGPGNLGLAVPDAQPYETIFRSMKTSRKVLAGMGREAEDMQVSGNDISGNSISGNSISENSASGNSMDAADPKDLVPNQEIRADVRPWLQDFTATWVKGHIRYGPEEIRAQIQAVYDAGYEEWILWNASNRYTEGGLLPEEMDS